MAVKRHAERLKASENCSLVDHISDLAIKLSSAVPSLVQSRLSGEQRRLYQRDQLSEHV